jgi:hypothetical protein
VAGRGARQRREEPPSAAARVELNGALSNPFTNHKSLLNQLTALHETSLRKAEASPRQPRSVSPRPSPVLETVALVLTLAEQPMRAREIHATAETLAGQQLHWSSVKASLAAGASGRSPRFERLRRGVYRLARDTPEGGRTWD